MKNMRIYLIILFISFSFIYFLPSKSDAYKPPLGIPDPGFGIDDVRPSRPSSWTSSIPGYYYVNYGNSGCSDSRSYGWPDSPRCTIPNSLSRGSYVEVHGNYNHTTGGTTDILGNGTKEPWIANTSGPVWIVGENISNMPTFTERTVIFGKYVYMDMIKFRFHVDDGSIEISAGASGYGANHIVVRNCEIAGNQSNRTYGVSVDGSPTDLVSYVVIYNNVVYNHGDMNGGDQDADALHAGNYSSYIWFLENNVHHTSGSGGWAGGAYRGADNCHHIYFGKNTIYKTRQSGLSVKYATDVIFSQNHLYDIVDTTWSPSKGIGFQYGSERLWAIFNKIHEARYGIYGGSMDGGLALSFFAIGNVIYNIHAPGAYGGGSWDEAGIMLNGASYRYIINNTIYNADAGINGPGMSDTYYYIENNIISNITKSNGNHVFIEHALDKSILGNSNLYQTGVGSEKIKWGSDTYTLSQFQTSVRKGQRCTAKNPLFISPSSDDLRLQSESPARDAGLADIQLTSNVYDTFQTIYGLDIRKDIAGIRRPQGRSWDMGAYEFLGSDSPPASPLNLKIKQ